MEGRFIEDSALLNPPAETESRLSRAAELAEYLRQNPKEAKRDSEELSAQFGLSGAMVTQIRASVQTRISGPTPNRKSLADRLTELWAALLKLAEGCVRYPFLFLLVAAAIVALEGVAPKGSTKNAVLLWCGLQAWCLLMRPRYRNAAFASAMIGLVAGAMFFHVSAGKPLQTPFSWPVFSVLVGFSLAFINLLGAGFLVLAGGAFQMAARRRKSAALSRQDLLMRMFELQHRLASLPNEPVKRQHPWVALARQRPFLAAAVLVFAASTLNHIVNLVFHVDTFPEAKGQSLPSPGSMPIGYLILGPTVTLLAWLVEIGLGLLASSWRRFWLIAGGMFVGNSVGTASAVLMGVGPASLGEAAWHPIWNLASGIFTVAIVRFGVRFNHALKSNRAGDALDEASIVGELLEIRHRLSANPATICVMVVDAVGSTGMKKVDDPLRVEYTFGRYQSWIGGIVAAFGGKVEIRTGDGAICAFGSAEPALLAAQKIQSDIVRFNAAENKLDLPFRLRVALHAGEVHAELDKVQFTEVIDVAAHTEKHSPIGGIALTEAFVQALPTPPDLPVCATVDGFQVRSMTA